MLVLLDAEGEPPACAWPEYLTVLLGPEGGFNAAEREMLRLRAHYRLRLAPTILRAVPAAVAAVSVLTQC
jgi:RsmE family RNA methyltransferase